MTNERTDPAEFLTAALDAAERLAKAAAEIWLGPDEIEYKPDWFVYGDSAAVIAGEKWTHTDDLVCNADDDLDNATFIAANDPAHVLRMVAAHRLILARYQDWNEHHTLEVGEPFSPADLETLGVLRWTVKLLAEAYGWTQS